MEENSFREKSDNISWWSVPDFGTVRRECDMKHEQKMPYSEMVLTLKVMRV